MGVEVALVATHFACLRGWVITFEPFVMLYLTPHWSALAFDLNVLAKDKVNAKVWSEECDDFAEDFDPKLQGMSNKWDAENNLLTLIWSSQILINLLW